MARVSDGEAAGRLAALLKSMPPDLVEQVIRKGRAVPEDWRRMSTAQMVRRLRGRFDMTQRQLAVLAGLPLAGAAALTLER